MNLLSTGNPFSWHKKRSGENNIYERIDKAMASMSWFNLFPSASLFNHVFTSSDHCQVLLKLDKVLHSKVPPFRFQRMLCTRKDFDVLITKTWCTRFSDSYMFCFVKKCKLIKSKIEEWSKLTFGNVDRQIQEVDSHIQSKYLVI